MGKTFWEMGCGDKHQEETALFEVRLHPGNQEKQSHPWTELQCTHARAHGIQALSRDKHLQKQMKSDFSEKSWEMVFPACFGDKVTIFSGRDMSSRGQGLGTIPLFLLNIDSKSKCLDFRELPKAKEPKGKWWKWEMSVLLNTLYQNQATVISLQNACNGFPTFLLISSPIYLP